MTIVANCRFLGMFSNLVSPVRPPGIILRSKIILPKTRRKPAQARPQRHDFAVLVSEPGFTQHSGPARWPRAADPLVAELGKRGIPHVVEGLNRLFDSAEILPTARLGNRSPWDRRARHSRPAGRSQRYRPPSRGRSFEEADVEAS